MTNTDRNLEQDLVDYIMGLWRMDKMRKMRKSYNGAIKLRGLTKKGQQQ